MLRIAFRKFRRIALTGSLAIAAGSSASAGLFCNWWGPAERPWYNPCNEPNWGVEETQWRRFPPAYGNMQQGSYCGPGGCPVSSGAPVMAVPPSGHSAIQAPIMPGHAAQPNPTLQKMIIPHHGSGPVAPNQGAAIPVFPAPTQGVPYIQQPGPSQFSDEVFTPHPIHPMPDNNLPPRPAEGSNMTAPDPAPTNGLGVPMPTDNMIPGGEQLPSNGLLPQPQGGGAGNGPGNLAPMDPELPPMPQAGYYQSPFSKAGYAASPGSMGAYSGNYSNANYPVTNYPAQNYPVAMPQMPTQGQYQQMSTQQSPSMQPRLPFKGVSFSSENSTPKPASRNPFNIMSRLWSRGK